MVQAKPIGTLVFFDGGCNLCSREIGWLKGRIGEADISFVDISQHRHAGEPFGLTHDDLMRSMRAVLPNGEVISGVAVFRMLYRKAGLGFLLAFTKLPFLSGLSEAAYRAFARWRYSRRLSANMHTRSCNKCDPA